MMHTSDWNRLAAEAAVVACETAFSTHRGAMLLQVGDIAVGVCFGNDGYTQDAQTRIRVDYLRRLLADEGIEVLGFGLDRRRCEYHRGEKIDSTPADRGYTWAMLVASDDVVLLGDMVEASFHETGGYPRRTIAENLSRAATNGGAA